MRGAGAFVETIEIEMIELQTSSVRVDECEGRAGDVLFRDSKSGADSFHKNCFACAERSAEQKNLATRETRADLMTVGERLLRSRTDELACRDL